jgi:hypothetical protein
MVTKLVVMIYGHLEGHLCRCVESGFSTSMVEASEGDPCRRVTPPDYQVVCPRQSVAGGRHRRLVIGGKDPALDRVCLLSLGFFLLISRPAFIYVVFQGLCCKMYPPLRF